MTDNPFFSGESAKVQAVEAPRLAVGKKSYVNQSTLGQFTDKAFNFDTERQKLLDNLNWYKSLEVEEYTFRKKWEELQEADNLDYGVVKANIWSPTDLNNEDLTVKEIEALQPRIFTIVDGDVRNDNTWRTLRKFCHSGEHNATIGRLMKFLVFDDVSGKIIGFCCINSEMPALSCRDTLIGITKKVWMAKEGKGTNNFSVQCSCIAPTQPFGYNFLGGKFIAALLTTSTVRDGYFKKYEDVLVGMTTTSLYGNGSMYNSLKWWTNLGHSRGAISLQPSDEVYKVWNDWLKENEKKAYNEAMTQDKEVSGPPTSPKQKVISMIFKKLEVKSKEYQHGFERGAYYSSFYENGYDLLNGKLTDPSKLVMKPLFKEDVAAVINWWKPKAISRYKKLKSEGRLKGEKLFYSDIPGMTYEQAKEKYFKDVGR